MEIKNGRFIGVPTLSENEFQIILYLNKHPSSTVYAIECGTDLEKSSIKYWLKKLVGKNVISESLKDKRKTYLLDKESCAVDGGVVFVRVNGNLLVVAEPNSPMWKFFEDAKRRIWRRKKGA